MNFVPLGRGEKERKSGDCELKIFLVCRIFIQNGCSPVGCVLAQLTKKWGAFVTSSCHVRSVPVIKALGESISIAFRFITF